MALADLVLPNQYPLGTRPGSPIEVVDTSVTSGGTTGTTGLVVPHTALEDDIVACFMGFGNRSGPGAISAFSQVPETFTYYWSLYSHSGGMSELAVLYHRVRKDEAGTSVGFHWDAPNYLQWGMISYTLRNVDPVGIFDSRPGSAQSGTVPSNATATGGLSTTYPGTLCIGAIVGNGGAGGGISAGPLPGWYNTVDASGGQPAFGFVSGYLDMPVPGGTEGAGMSFEQPAGTPIPTDWCGFLIPFKAVPAPARPGVSLSPAPPSVDVQGGSGLPLTLSWVWSPAPGQGDQVAWMAARQVAGTGALPGWWNADKNVWQTTPYWNVGKERSYVFPDGAFVNDGTNWQLLVAVMEGKNNLHSALDLAASVTFTADPAPKVVVTAPAGAVTASPTIGWAPTITRPGSVETAWQVRLFDSLQYDAVGFNPATSSPRSESGTVASSAETWTPSPLRGGAFYQAWVRIQQTGGQWSAWEFLGFYADYNAPALPTFTLTPDTDPVTGCPRTRVDITGHDSVGGGLDGTTFVTLYRYDPKSQTLVATRNNVGVPVPWPAQTLTLFDYDMPPNQIVSYAVRSFSNKPPPVFTLDDPALGLLDTAGAPLA